MHSSKSLFRLIEIGIVVVAVALAYIYRDALREAYENAKGYVQHTNERLGIETGGSETKAPAVSPPPAPVAEKPEQRPQVVVEAQPQSQPQMQPGPATSAQPSAPSEVTTPSQPAPAPAVTPPAAPAAVNAPAPQAKVETAPAAPPAEIAPAPQTQAPAASLQATEHATAPPAAPAQSSAVPPSAASQAPATSPEPAQPAVPAAPATAPKATMPEIGPTAGESAAPSLSSMLSNARALAKSGRNAEAADAYRGIIQRYPDSHAAFGELGNIYYAQGKRQDAASSYYQAALRLLQAGYSKEAERLAGTVRSLDPILGGSLQTKITLARMRRH